MDVDQPDDGGGGATTTATPGGEGNSIGLEAAASDAKATAASDSKAEAASETKADAKRQKTSPAKGSPGPAPASLSRPKRASATATSEAIRNSLKTQDDRKSIREEKAGATPPAVALQGPGGGSGGGKRRGGGAAQPLLLRPVFPTSLPSEEQASAVVVAEFAHTFLLELLQQPPYSQAHLKQPRAPTPVELRAALAGSAGAAGATLLDALHMSLLHVLLKEENLAVDNQVEPHGPGVESAAAVGPLGRSAASPA